MNAELSMAEVLPISGSGAGEVRQRTDPAAAKVMNPG